jgi:ribose transport system substrate-binding protein
VLLIGGLTACGGSKETGAQDSSKSEDTASSEDTSSSDDTASSEDIKVGVILKTLSSEYWGYVAAGVKAAEKDLGVTVELQGPASETSYDEQNNMIETMLGSGDLDAFVLSPLQPDSVSTVLGDTSVPVLFVDTDADYEPKVSYIGTGNYEAAYLGGEYAASLAGEGAKAVILAGVQGNTSSDEREGGAKDALEANGVEVVAVQYAEGLADKAASIMENLLTSLNNDVQIVMCNNDEIASGASRAIAQAGLEDIIVVGFDGIQAGVQNVIDGAFSATVAQSPFNMGYMAVEKAVAVAKGESIDSLIDTGAKVITEENAQEYLDELKEMLGE